MFCKDAAAACCSVLLAELGKSWQGGGELTGPLGHEVVANGLRAAGRMAASGVAQVLVMGLTQFSTLLTASITGKSMLSASLSVAPDWERKK